MGFAQEDRPHACEIPSQIGSQGPREFGISDRFQREFCGQYVGTKIFRASIANV